jgi:hypothetical protein
MSRHMNMSEDEARETWSKLKAAIAKIHEQNASSLSFEELYRHAYKMVLHRHAQMLYTGMENSLRQHLRQMTNDLDNRSDLAFVRQLLIKWHAYHKSTQLVRDILMVCLPFVGHHPQKKVLKLEGIVRVNLCNMQQWLALMTQLLCTILMVCLRNPPLGGSAVATS